MAAFYTIFRVVFSDETLSKEDFLLDYEECLVFLGLKYNTMLTRIELTEILEMALLRSNRIPERVKSGYLVVSKVLNGSAPRFLVLKKVDNFWDYINLTKREKKKFSELPQYVLQFNTRMSSHLIKLNEYKEFYKGFKGKALYKLFMLDYFGILLALTFEKERFTTAVKVNHLAMIDYLNKNTVKQLLFTEYDTLVQVSLLMLDLEVTQFFVSKNSCKENEAHKNGELIVFPVNMNKIFI
jgi:hypothetical protein